MSDQSITCFVVKYTFTLLNLGYKHWLEPIL